MPMMGASLAAEKTATKLTKTMKRIIFARSICDEPWVAPS
jgi:hypothetical protein